MFAITSSQFKNSPAASNCNSPAASSCIGRQNSPDAVLEAFRAGNFIPKTVLEGRIVSIQSEEEIKRLCAKHYRIGLNDNGDYFLSPPGLVGGAPTLNTTKPNIVQGAFKNHLSEMNKALDAGDQEKLTEHLVALKSLVFLSKEHDKESIIIDFIQVLSNPKSSSLDIQVKSQLFYFLKFLAISNLAEINNANHQQFLGICENIFSTIEEHTKVLKATKHDSKAPLFHLVRALYELETAEILLKRQFSAKKGTHLPKLKTLETVVKALTGNHQAMVDCLKIGLTEGIKQWSDFKENDRLKTVLTLEIINYSLLRLNPQAKQTEEIPTYVARKLVEQLTRFYDSNKDTRTHEDWILLYACLEGLCLLAERSSDKQVTDRIYSFLISCLPFPTTTFSPATFFGRTQDLKKQIEVKLIEVIWHLSFFSLESEEYKKYLLNLDKKIFKEIEWFSQVDVEESFKAGACKSQFIPTFVKEDLNWPSLLEPLYLKIAEENPSLRAQIKDKNADEISPWIFTEENKITIEKSLFGDKTIYLKAFCHYLVALDKGIIIPPVNPVNAPKIGLSSSSSFIAQVVPPAATPKPLDLSEDEDWRISRAESLISPNDNPYQLPSLALNFLNGTQRDLRVPQIIFCINSYIRVMEADRRIPLANPQQPQNHLIMLFAETGAGKSTTANFLSGYPMVKKKIAGVSGKRYDLVAPNTETFQIGHSTKSTTFVPQYKRLRENNLCICDTPGPNDNHGFAVRIAIAAGMAHLVGQAQSLRILVLMPYSDFDTKMTGVDRVLTALENRLANFRTNVGSVLFGITQFPSDFDEDDKRITVADLQKRVSALFNIRDPIADQVVFIEPDNQAQKGVILNQLNQMQAVPATNDLFRAVLDAETREKLGKITNALSQRIESLFQRRNFAEIITYFDQLLYLDHLDESESRQHIQSIKGFIRGQIEGVVNDIRSIVKDPTPARAALRTKMQLLLDMRIFSRYITTNPTIEHSHAEFTREIDEAELKLQQEIKGKILSNFNQLQNEFLNELLQDQLSFINLDNVYYYQQAVTRGNFQIPARIEELQRQMRIEEANRSSMYFTGNRVPLTPLLEEIIKDLNSLVFETYVQKRLAHIEAEFHQHLSDLEANKGDLVDKNYHKYSATQTLSSLLPQNPLNSCFQNVEKLLKNRARLSHDTQHHLENKQKYFQEQIDLFFKDIQTEMRAKKVESLEINILNSVNKPPLDNSWDNDCILLHKLNLETYLKVAKTLQDRLVEKPKRAIETELTSPSQQYSEVLRSSLQLFDLTLKLPSFFKEVGMEAKKSLQEKIKENEATRYTAEIKTFEDHLTILLGNAKAIFEKTRKENKFNLFSSSQNSLEFINQLPGLSNKVFTDLSLAVQTKRERYTTLDNDSRLLRMEKEAKKCLDDLVTQGRLDEENARKAYDFAMVSEKINAEFDVFLKANAKELQLSDITWQGLKRLHFSKEIMQEYERVASDKKEIFLSAAREKTKKMLARVQYDVLVSACANIEINILADEGKIPHILKVISECDPELYKKSIEILQDHLIKKFNKEEVQKSLGVGSFSEVTSFYQTLITIQQQAGNRLEIDTILSSLNDGIQLHMRHLYENAQVELSCNPKANTYFNHDNLKKFLEFSNLMGQNKYFIQNLQSEYVTLLQSTSDQFKSLNDQSDNPQSDNPQDALERTAKQMVKLFILGVYFEKIDDCVKKLRKGIEPLKDHTMFHLKEKIEELKLNYPDVAGNISGMISYFPELASLEDEDRYKKTEKTTFALALEKLEAQGCNRTTLQTIYNHFRLIYESQLKNILDKNFNHEECRKSAKNISDKLTATELYRSPKDLGALLAYIFAAWTDSHTPQNHQFVRISKLKQPHPTQVLAILRLIGADEPNSIQNHINEILTGEGKSVCLGATATLFAILGYDVNVLCYNPYLSERDKKLFQELFNFFEVIEKIYYGDIGSIVSNYIEEKCFPNRFDYVNKFLRGEKVRPFGARDASKRILLIDEVDVFFGPDFYGKTSGRIVILNSGESIELIKFMWNNRAKFFNGTYTVNTVMQSPLVAEIQSTYPNLGILLENEVKMMIEGLKQFPLDGETTHECHCHDNLIGYRNEVTCSVNDHIYNSDYSTQYAYLYYREKGEITSDYALDGHLGVMINCGVFANAKIPEFFSICLGMTGTVKDLAAEEKEILAKFGMNRFSYIPTAYFDKKVTDPKNTKIIKGEKTLYYQGIKESIKTVCIDHRRACLVVFENNKELEEFKKWLENNPENLSRPEKLDEYTSFDKRESIIYQAGDSGKITLLTKQYGRGTDFMCRDRLVLENGGMHVIATYMPESAAEETQVRGRTGRQDNRGSFEKILYAPDLISKGYNIEKDTGYEELKKQREGLIKNQFSSVSSELEKNKLNHETTHNLMLAIENGQTSKAFEYLKSVN